MTDWQPKPGQRVHVHAYDGVVTFAHVDGTFSVKRDGEDEWPFAYVRPEHMTPLPDPEPAWWPPQPGDIGTRDGGTWTVAPGGEVKLMTSGGFLAWWLNPNPVHGTSYRLVAALLDQHPTLVIRDGKPWPQP